MESLEVPNGADRPSVGKPDRLRAFRWILTAAIFGALLAVLYFGASLRTRGMIPADQAVSYQWDYDEGVHLQAAQLMLQGSVPYRDYVYLQPPFSLLILGTVLRFHWVPWGDTVAFVLVRYAAMAFGLVAIAGVFGAGRLLGGPLSGLVSAGVLAMDATVIQVDRQAMLEPFANGLSIAAILCCLLAFETKESRRRWLAIAGIIGALAGLTKTTAMVALGAIFVFLLGRLLWALIIKRIGSLSGSVEDTWKTRMGDLAIVLASALAAIICVVGYFIVTCPSEFARQVYLFHLVRPTDGTVEVAQRFTDMLTNPGSHLTFYFAAAGLGIILLRGLFQGGWGRWALVLLWTGAVLAVFATSRTFFPHYYSQLAVPLSVLAGGLVATGNRSREIKQQRFLHAAIVAAQVIVVASVIISNLHTASAQYEEAKRAEVLRSSSVGDISSFLAANTPSRAKVFSFQPIYSFVGSREPAQIDPGGHLVDSYGFLLYINVGMEEEWLPEVNDQGIWDAIHGRDAQTRIAEIAGRADYVVIDRQARWALNPEIVTTITAGRKQVFEAGKVAVYSENEQPTDGRTGR